MSSSAISRVIHDPNSGTLDIWYRGGRSYSYFGVPKAVYDALLAAPSKGAFVNSEIKPYYRFTLKS